MLAIYFSLLLFLQTPCLSQPINVIQNFLQVDTSTKANEISAQGEYVFILRQSDNQLMTLVNSNFILVSTPSSITLSKIAVHDNGTLYACTATKTLWKLIISSGVWSQIVLGGFYCDNVAVGNNSFYIWILSSHNDSGVIPQDYRVYKFDGTSWSYNPSYHYYVLGGLDTNNILGINWNSGLFKLTTAFLETTITTPIISRTSNSNMSISSPTESVVYISLDGILYIYEIVQNTLRYLASPLTVITNNMNINKISCAKGDLPWIIANSGNIYHSFCTNTNEFYSQKTSTCVTSCSVDTVEDISRKTCFNCVYQGNKAAFHGKCYSITSCSSDFGAENHTDYSTTKGCQCNSSKFYYSKSFTQYSPISLPTTNCIDNCNSYDLFSWDEGKGWDYNTCASCKLQFPSTPFYDEQNKICVSVCPNTTISDSTNKVCINCKNVNKLFFRGECITTSCAAVNAAVGPDTALIAQCQCSLTGYQYYYPSNITQYSDLTSPIAKSCVASCSQYNLVVTNDSYGSNLCKQCKDVDASKPIFDKTNNKCVSTCPKYTNYDIAKNLCIDCNPKYYISGSCLEGTSCSSFNAIVSDPTTPLACICPTDSPFFFTDNLKYNPKLYYPPKYTCIKSCNELNLVIKSTDNYGGQTCIPCSELNPNTTYFDQVSNTCITSCPANTIQEDSHNLCRNCKLLSKLFYKGVCVDACPRTSVIKYSDKLLMCEDCPAGMKILNNICVTSCGSGYIFDVENICIKCNVNEFDFENKCVTECPKSSVILKLSCINCKNSNTVYIYNFNNQCINQIPTNTLLIDADFNKYVACKDANPPQHSSPDGICTSKCKPGTGIYQNGTECVTFKSIGKFLYTPKKPTLRELNGIGGNDEVDMQRLLTTEVEGYIVDECPTAEFLYPDSDNVCKVCSDMISKSIFCSLSSIINVSSISSNSSSTNSTLSNTEMNTQIGI